MMFSASVGGGSFQARSRGYDVTVHPRGASLQLRDGGGSANVGMRFAGGRSAPLIAEQGLPTRLNYLRGDRKDWRTGVATYGAVRARGVYRGIDALFYGTGGNLEYDLIVAPGASPRSIRLSFPGSERVEARDGQLHIHVENRILVQRKPVAYQEIEGERVAVDVRYRVRGPEVGFDVGSYDPTFPVVIDPILHFSTYFGATGRDAARSVAIDAAGNTYVGGTADAADLPGPTARPHTPMQDPGSAQNGDAYIAKFRDDGTVEWISYVGGSHMESGAVVAVGPDGDVYAAGATVSSDFPVTAGAFHSGAPTSNQMDLFLFRLAPDGTTLRFSTYLGAPQPRWNAAINAIEVDSQGRAYIAGTTGSMTFPVTIAESRGPQQPGIENTEAFVARFSADGSGIDFSRLLAGSFNDIAADITLDAGGVYVVGTTFSLDYPVRNALYPSHFGPSDPDGEYGRDGFLSYVANDGGMWFSTYLGGMGEDSMTSVVRGQYDRVYVGGYTTSNGIEGWTKPSPAGIDSGIIYQLVPNASSIVSVRYVGSSGAAQIHKMAVTNNQDLWVLGTTDGADWSYSSNWPTPPAQGHPGGGRDLFLQKWSSDLTGRGYSDTFGGAGHEYATGIALNATGDVFVVGATESANYPLRNPVQSSLNTSEPGVSVHTDGIVTRFSCNFFELGPTPTQPAAGGDGQTWTYREEGCVLNAVSEAPWLHVTGYESLAVKFRTDANTSSTARTGYLVVSGRHRIPITQYAGAPPAEPEDGPADIVLNPRDATLIRGTWTLAPDDVHGQILTQPDAVTPKIGTAAVSPANYFEFRFYAEAGRPYHLWIHGRAQNDSWQNDSAYVQFSDSVDANGNPVFRINSTSATWVSLEECSGCGEQGWGWQDNAYGSPGNLGPNIYFASPGIHTIRVQQREDGFDIGQIVLSGNRYLATAPGGARNDNTIVASEPPDPATHDEIVLWTAWHSQNMHGTWQLNRTDSTASGGATLWNPDFGAPKLESPLAEPANYVDITFTADAFKPYHLWLRMKAIDDSWRNDSVWVQFSGAVDASGNPVSRIGTTSGTWVSLEECSGCGTQGWGWQDNAYGSPGNLGPDIYFAASGLQTIRIQIREDGLALDQIVLSAGRYLKSAPGAAKNDATILPQTR